MSGLNVGMNVFQQMIADLTEAPNNMTETAATALVEQVVAIGNSSAIFSAEIKSFNKSGILDIGATTSATDPGTASFQPATATTGPTINLPTILDFPANAEGLTYTANGAAEQTLSQAGQIVGVLARELGHYEDKELQGIANTNSKKYLSTTVAFNQALDAGVGLLGEGKAVANQIAVAEQVADDTGGNASDLVLVQPDGIPLSAATASGEIKFLNEYKVDIAEATANAPATGGSLANSILSALATNYVNNSVSSTPGNLQDIVYYLEQWNGTKDPFLYEGGNPSGALWPVDRVAVVASPTDNLQKLKIFWSSPVNDTNTGADTALTIYNLPGQWRKDFSSTTPSVDTQIDYYAQSIATPTALELSKADDSLVLSGSGGASSILPLLASASAYKGDVFVAETGEDGGTEVLFDSDGQNIVLSEPSSFVLIEKPADFTGVIDSFDVGDTIDLAGVGLAASATLAANNVLDVQESNGKTVAIQLDPKENDSNFVYTVSSDGHGGTDIVKALQLIDNFNEYPLQTDWTPTSQWTVLGGANSNISIVDSKVITDGNESKYVKYGNFVDLGETTNKSGILRSDEYFAAGDYELSFDLSGNARQAPAQTTTVTLGNYSTSITVAANAPFNVYTSDISTNGGYLEFQDTTGGNQPGNLIDNVKLVARV